MRTFHRGQLMDEAPEQWRRELEPPAPHRPRAQQTLDTPEPPAHHRVQRRERRVHVPQRGLLPLQTLSARAPRLPAHKHAGEAQLHVHSPLAHSAPERLGKGAGHCGGAAVSEAQELPPEFGRVPLRAAD